MNNAASNAELSAHLFAIRVEGAAEHSYTTNRQAALWLAEDIRDRMRDTNQRGVMGIYAIWQDGSVWRRCNTAL